MDNRDLKKNVKDFWNSASCGENLFLKGFTVDDYLMQSKLRYAIEPEIIKFAEFNRFKDLKTLEIGVGLGSDHMMLAQNGAVLTGIDLTDRAIEHTKRRFELLNLTSNLLVADAEKLPFSDNEFDAIYSWGVIHHSPNMELAISEIYRVLKKGGSAKIMIYHKYSLVGYMLWIRYGLFKFKPNRSLKFIYHHFLESPGTKAYSKEEAKQLFRKFKIISINTPLNHGDLLTSEAGQRHKGVLLTIVKKIWPRWFFKRFMSSSGLEMLIEIQKLG